MTGKRSAVLLAMTSSLVLGRAWGQATPPVGAVASPPTGARIQETPRPEAATRLPVRGGVIVLKVNGYDEARARVTDAARRVGAEVLDARTEVSEKGRKHGWMRLRLPAGRLVELLPALRATGRLYAENLQTGDRTGEYEQLARRVERLSEHQARLSRLLESSRKLRGSDILYVQERLFRASVDADLLRQQRLDIERAARASTITVQLFEPLPDSTVMERARESLAVGFARARGRAGEALGRTLARATTASAYALVWSPVWLPLVVAAVLVGRWLWRRGRRLVTLLSPLARDAAALMRRRTMSAAAPNLAVVSSLSVPPPAAS